MSEVPPPIRVRVDPNNPGQFFACCGLLELGERLWPGAEAWFNTGTFFIRVPFHGNSLAALLTAIGDTPLHQLDHGDDYSSPIELVAPFNLRLDWWKDRTGGQQLKVWAGSMRGVRIATAMKAVLRQPEVQGNDLLDFGTVVYDPSDPDNKVEPFYFDARRGANARSIDIGFAPDALQMTNAAYPAVEFLCLVGLQRFRPMPTNARRVFTYNTWSLPLPTRVVPLAICGMLAHAGGSAFRFEVAFRTDQRKHKAFTPATPATRR